MNLSVPSSQALGSSPATGRSIRTVAFYSLTGEDALAHLRFLGPARHLGLRIVKGVEDGKVYPERAAEGDAVVIQRDFPLKLAEYERIVCLSRAAAKPVIFDLDDLLLELPEDHPNRQTHGYTAALLPILQALTEVDLVTVSTSRLRGHILAYNKNVVVLPNYLNDQLWRLKSPSTDLREPGMLTVGYMGGASHAPDLEAIVPALLQVVQQYPGRLRFCFWGMEPPAALADQPMVEWYPGNSGSYTDFAEYFQRQAADIFLAPLCENEFNACKSSIKYLEYGALGAPGIFSRIAPYSEVIVDGANGLLASSAAEWAQALVRLIEDPPLRLAIAQNAQEDIRSGWLLSDHAVKWLDAYEAADIPANAVHSETSFHQLVYSLSHQVSEQFGLLNKYIDERQRTIEALRSQLEQRDRELLDIKTSKSWKVARTLRNFWAKIAPPNSRAANAASRVYKLATWPFLQLTRWLQRRSDLQLLRHTDLFDGNWYTEQNPDIRRSGIDPAFHYLTSGAFEGRDPSARFSSRWYLETYADVRAATINPLIHYLRSGQTEGRSPRPPTSSRSSGQTG